MPMGGAVVSLMKSVLRSRDDPARFIRWAPRRRRYARLMEGLVGGDVTGGGPGAADSGWELERFARSLAGRSPATVRAYRSDLAAFTQWAGRSGIEGPGGVGRLLLRRYLASLGTPIVGAKLYGPDDGCFARGVDGELTESDVARLELPRHALHAWRLMLPHPATHEDLTIEAPLTADLEAFWHDLA